MSLLPVVVTFLLACACAGRSLEPPPTSAELEGYALNCAADQDCTGRLRCIAYNDISGRPRQQCFFPCNDGCPDRWVCAREVPDGASNTCFAPTGN
jgi:hypothetical protein